MTKLLLAIGVFLPMYSFSQLWQNDFSNASEWISTDLNGGTDTWTINSSAIGGDVDSISSASAGNGFSQFNSEGQCSGTHQDVVLMYYQPIDISSNELSYLELIQHYKRKSDSVYVEFSNDGLIWESVRINQQYWFYQQTTDPDTIHVSIPASVQAAPFWMRFRYSGECGFAWLIDDLKIFEKEEHSLIAHAAMITNEKDYYAINHCLMDTIDLSLSLTNFGFDTLFSVVVATELFEDGISEQTQFDTIDVISPGADTIITLTDYYPAYTWWGGSLYTLVAKLFSAELDTVKVVDTLNFNFYETLGSSPVVEGVFQTSNEVRGLGYSFIVPDNENGYCSSHNYLYIPEQTTGGQIIYLAWYKKVNGDWVYSSQTNDVSIPTTGTTGVWIELNYFGTDYLSGDTGLVMITTYGDEVPISYGKHVSGGNVYLFNELYEPYLDPEGHEPLIKTTFGYLGDCSCLGGWDELSTIDLNIYPNPASVNQVMIELAPQSFSNLTNVEIVVTDVTGKIIHQTALMNHTYLWQTGNTQNGVYFVTIKSSGKPLETQKLIVNR